MQNENAGISPSPKRHCWECVRRRLVCDSTRPSCKKCAGSGVECPGYGEKKPLKWLQPGQVNSQRGRSKATDRDRPISPRQGQIQVREPNRSDDLDEQIPLAPVREAWGEMVDLIPRFDLREETAEVVHSVHYYNQRVLPEYNAMSDMFTNPFVVPFPLKVLHHLPAVINHAMAYFGYGYRIHRGEIQDRPSKAKAWARVYHHRGLVISELKDLVARDPAGCNDLTLMSISQVLVTEIIVLQSSSGVWRDHAAWLSRLIQFRGGFLHLMQSSKVLPGTLSMFMVIVVFANVSSPATSQLNITSPVLFISEIEETYDQIFPYILCPKALFIDIITINNIRGETMYPDLVDDTSRHAAEEVLSRIIAFSPAQWALGQPSHREEWEVIATLYQSCVAIYCILSLQELSLLPPTPDLQAIRIAYGGTLLALLDRGLSSLYVSKFMTWPLIIAGVEAVHRGKGTQSRVADALESLGVKTGTSTPQIARARLEVFWASGKKGWDDCFDRPYAFVV